MKLFNQAVQFLLARTTTCVAYRDECALGIDAEPDKAIATESAWQEIWAGLPQGYAMMPADTFERLRTNGVPMRILARDVRRVIVSRQ